MFKKLMLDPDSNYSEKKEKEIKRLIREE